MKEQEFKKLAGGKRRKMKLKRIKERKQKKYVKRREEKKQKIG